jgi:phenylacetic acid degradation operon negative regulatory protein
VAAFVETLLDGFHERTPIRAGSLIITVFGDAVVPRGGVLSVVTLVEIMRAFRINESLVRTALSRLVSDGWFERRRLGRRSYYRLAPQGSREFERATERIYTDTPHAWRGSFEMVLLDGPDRQTLRAELFDRGYGVLGPEMLVAPSGPGPEIAGSHLRLTATASDRGAARRLAARAWPLAEVEARYHRFIEIYSVAREALKAGDPFSDLEALIVRILLIHDFRRAVLKDPLLPAELLPDRWAGRTARDLCAEVYLALAPFAERWLDQHAENDRGLLPAAEPGFARRFQPTAPAPRYGSA